MNALDPWLRLALVPGVGNTSDRAIKLPDARSGLLMVYRVYDRVSYALIMQSDGPVYLLDTVKNP